MWAGRGVAASCASRPLFLATASAQGKPLTSSTAEDPKGSPRVPTTRRSLRRFRGLMQYIRLGTDREQQVHLFITELNPTPARQDYGETADGDRGATPSPDQVTPEGTRRASSASFESASPLGLPNGLKIPQSSTRGRQRPH